MTTRETQEPTPVPLPAAAPSEAGIDADGIRALVDALDAAPDIEPHSLMVLRGGRVAAAGWWAPYAAHRPHLLYSLSKSFTSTAAGLAAGEGVLDPDDLVLDHFPEFADDITDPRSRGMRVRHVASMASGHLAETRQDAFGNDREEPVRGFLLIPPDRDPGTVFAYNQPCTYTLASIVQKHSGQSLVGYLRPRLFDPLGIGGVGWVEFPEGRSLGFTGMYATTDAVARLGQLYLQRGRWDGKQLLPESWVEEATRSHISTGDSLIAGGSDESDWAQGYGFQFWQSRHGFRGDGAYGQFCLVLPEYDTVVATTAQTENMQGILTAVWTHLLPAIGAVQPGDAAAAADAALTERLATLGLPPAAGTSAAPPAGTESGWDGREFTPDAESLAGQRTLTAVRTVRDGDGWTAELTDEGRPFTVRIPGEGWWDPAAPADDAPPVAATGGWTADGRLELDVAFVETPHRLRIRGGVGTGECTARWSTQPLHGGPLRRHRSPRRG